ncbi:MAG: Ig-like domain-containing protein [Pirellulaceae bacterium]
MKQHPRSIVARTLQRVSHLWKHRQQVHRRKDRRDAFLFEPLESRMVMAGDLDQGEGEGTAPTLVALPNIVVHGGSAQWVPLDGFDTDGGAITYTATSTNSSLVSTNVPTGNQSVKMSVAGFGDMYFQLFEHLAPRVTSRIIELVNSGFYDDTATNTITFHRILNDFVIQAGDPTGTGSGGSTLPDFADQFHVDLQHNRSGLLSMAKTTDDTNDSQFFITEERNEGQAITLAGSPTGGTFTLTYFDQTTSPIAFSNSGNFTAMAASIRTALEGLSRIGTGNVAVSHDPARNSQGQVTENRRWRVDFVNALGRQEVVNLTGGDSLTGGTNPALIFDEIKSARHLDFNHSIFGMLTQGEAVRDAISNVATTDGVPTAPPTIGNVDILVDPENGALLLKAPEGASGEADITVRATDAQGNFTERTFHVIVSPDGFNGAPFLNDLSPVNGTAGLPIALQLVAQDAENNPLRYEAAKPQGNTVDYTLNVNNETGLVTITPPAGFVGSFNVLVGVTGATPTDTGDSFDTQLVTVNVAGATPTGVDLLPASDTGSSDSDNITNAGTLQMQVQGVANGATVKLYRGDTFVTQAVATGTTVTLSVPGFDDLADGVYSFRATQTLGSAESDVSPARDVTLDTTPPAAFTSTAPTEALVGVPIVYDAQIPGEGTTGFSFSLTSAPVGATINPATGQLIWTPAAAQQGDHVFQIVAKDSAGNATQQTINLNVDPAQPTVIDVTLTLTRPDGTPLTSLGVGQDFVLNVFVEDVRDDAQGVASIYVDLLFDPARAEVTGALSFGSIYQLFQSGTTTTPGLVDEVGAFGQTSPIGPGKFKLVSIPMRSKAAGPLTITADPADDTEARPAAVYLDNEEIVFQEIRFGTASIAVNSTFLAVNDTFNANEDAQNQTLTPLANDTIAPGSGNVLTISAVGATNQGGTVQIAADGKSLIYRPAANFFGSETFTYTVRNQNNETSVATVAVQVAARNDPPTAVDDAATTGRNSSVFTIPVLGNDVFTPDANETLRVSSVTQPSQGGTAAVGPNGANVTFTPAQGFTGTAAFTYTLSDGNGGTDTASVTVTVSNINPTAANDTATVAEDTTAGTIVNVLANDALGTGTGAGTTLTVTAVGTTSNGGTVAVGASGANVVYTPAANFQGTETFTYTVGDGASHTATATVTVTVANANNDPPTAGNDSLTAFKNTPAVFDVLLNDSSAPDPAETLTIDSVTTPLNGTLQITNNGTRLTYTPNNNYTGVDSFAYTIKDPGGATATATATLNVAAFVPSSLGGFVFFDVDNDGAKDASESILAGVTVRLTGTDINNAAVNQTARTSGDGSYKFDNLAPGNYTIIQTQPGFTIDGRDRVGSQGGANRQNDRIAVQLAQNTHGTGNNFGERGRQASLITLADFFASKSRSNITAAFDSAGNELWRSMKGSAFPGYADTKLSLQNGGNRIRVEGTNGQSQPVSATLPIDDSRVRVLGSSGAHRLIQLASFDLQASANPANRAPVAVANQYTLTEDTPLTISAAQGVLKNDTDADGDSLTATVLTQPQNGTLTLNPNGSFTYTPAANYSGPDSFTYRASDGTASSNAATVSFAVGAVNDTPTGVANSYTTPQNTILTVALAQGVLANDTDPEGSTLTAAVVTQPLHGSLTLNTNGSFTFTPTTGYTGPDSFTYRVSDGTNQSAPVTVSLSVALPNQPPVANGDGYTATEDTPLTVSVNLGVLGNDSDVNGNPLTAVVVNQPLHGTVLLNGNGSFTYTPAANYNGPDSFTYKANDGTLDSPVATVNLSVTAVNDAPVVASDAHTTAEDTPLTIAVAQGVLANDTDMEGNALVAAIGTLPQQGTVTLNTDGSFTYTPAANFNGTDSFTYTAGDGTSASTPATVTLTITPVNDAPEAVNDSYTVDENLALTVAVAQGVLANDSDAESSALTATVVAQPENGTLTLNTDGSFVYTPDADFFGTDGFSYKANDGTIDSQVAAVTVTVVEAGEGEAGALSDAALLALLLDSDDSGLDVLLDLADWQYAVDRALEEMAA